MQALENNIGILHEVSGFTYDTLYDLIFTSERVVAIQIQSPSDVLLSDSWWSMMFTGWLSKRNEQIQRQKIIKERHGQSQTLTLDDLLLKNNDNLEIHYSELASIEMKRRLFQYQLSFNYKGISKNKSRRMFIIPKNQIPELNNIFGKNRPFFYSLDLQGLFGL